MERKNLFSTMWATIVIVSLMMVAVSTNAFAATRALTTITNTASVNYKSQTGTGDYNASDTKVLTIAYKVVINITDNAAVTPVEANTTVSVPFTVTNSGNYADNYDVTLVGIFKDVDHSGIMDNGESYLESPWTVTYDGTDITLGGTHVKNTGSLDDVAHEGTPAFTRNVVVTLPNIPDYNDDYIVVLSVTSKAIENTPADLHIVNPSWSENWKLPIYIRKPHIVLTVAAPSGTNKVPGTNVTYTINAANNGPVALSTGTVSFALNGTYTSFFSAPTAATTGATTTWTITNLAANGGSVGNLLTVAIERTSNNFTGPVNGTTVNVTASNIGISHSFFGFGITQHPGSDASFAVNRAYGISITDYSPKSLDGEPDQPTTYYFKIKNEGNADAAQSETDVFHFVKTQTTGTTGYLPSDMAETYAYSIATVDPSTPGVPSTVVSWTSIGSSAAFDQSTAGISGGVERYVKVVVGVPGAAQNGESRTFKFQVNVPTATQSGNNSVMNLGSYFTSAEITNYELIVRSPKLDIVLTNESIYSSVGNTDKDHPYPGDVVTFLITVTNSGPKDATQIIVSQQVPATMDFVTQYNATAGSGIMFGVVECTNADDVDDANFVDGTKTVTTKAFVLASTASKEIRFKASVK